MMPTNTRISSEAYRLGLFIVFAEIAIISGFKWKAEILQHATALTGLIAAITFAAVLIQIVIANTQLELARAELDVVREDLANSKVVTDVVVHQQIDAMRRAKIIVYATKPFLIAGKSSIQLILVNTGRRMAMACNINLFFAPGCKLTNVKIPKMEPYPVHFEDNQVQVISHVLFVDNFVLFPKAHVSAAIIHVDMSDPIPDSPISWQTVYEDDITPPYDDDPIPLAPITWENPEC